MTHIEAMKQGLEALRKAMQGNLMFDEAMEAFKKLDQAIAEFDSHTLYREGYVNGYAFGEAAGRKAIAKQDGVCQHCAGKGCVACDAREQEPVIDKSAAIRIATALGWEPKREWVGLTNEEWVNALGKVREQLDGDVFGGFYRAIEAKLKQKNGYAEENT